MVTSMLTFPEKMSDVGKLGSRVLGLLIVTSAIASIEGLFWAWLFQPGRSLKVPGTVTPLDAPENKISELETLLNIFDIFVPDNVIIVMLKNRIISIFSLFTAYGIFLRSVP